MNNDRRNAFTRHTGKDTLLNGVLIATVIVGLLIAALNGPAPAMAAGNATVASSAVVSGLDRS